MTLFSASNYAGKSLNKVPPAPCPRLLPRSYFCARIATPSPSLHSPHHLATHLFAPPHISSSQGAIAIMRPGKASEPEMVQYEATEVTRVRRATLLHLLHCVDMRSLALMR